MKAQIIKNRYNIIKKISEDSVGESFLAKDLVQNINVEVKFFKINENSHKIEDIISFQLENQKASSLNNENILRIYDWGEIKENLKNKQFIITEYFPGTTLSQVNSNEISLSDSIKIIRNLVQALIFCHKNDVIHRNLSGGHILIKKKNNSLDFSKSKLTGFGFSHIQQLKDSNDVCNTFHFIAPEQTGLVFGNVDERSDLYSLGVLFYWLVCGKFPFDGNTASSVIHQQISASPLVPTKVNPSVPLIVERIILKLLQKDPHERYQTSQGLWIDLEKFQAGTKSFILGLEDKRTKLNFRTRLIGRAVEYKKLLKAYIQVKNGKSCLFLVKGEAGCGKTRLVKEVKDYILKDQGLFLEAKCKNDKTKNPYGAIKELLSQYLEYFQWNDSKEKRQKKEKISEKFKDLGRIILNFKPEMKEIIEECSKLVELEPEQENQRFIHVLSELFKEFAIVEKNLTLFIDDIQWADEGTYNLLLSLIKQKKVPLFIILAIRKEEDSALLSFINQIGIKESDINEVSLPFFNIEQMIFFVSKLLLEDEKNTSQIADFIIEKSKGNPFFTIEILKQMIREKVLITQQGQWVIDNKNIGKIDFYKNILDSLVNRISLLEKEEIEILSYAAVIGVKFNVKLLLKVYDSGESHKVMEILYKAMELQLLEEDIKNKGQISFVHDRIREAFYKNINLFEKQQLHETIGKSFENIYFQNSREINKVIFDLAYHFIESENNDKIVKYAFDAALKAQKIYANKEAQQLFRITANSLEKLNKKKSKKWLACLKNIAEVSLVIGDFDKTIKIGELIIHLFDDKISQAKIYHIMSQAYFKKGDFNNCELYSQKCLHLLNEKLPLKKVVVLYNIIKEFIYHFILMFLKKKKVKVVSEKNKLIIQNFLTLNWAYLFCDIRKMIRTILRMLNLSQRKMRNSIEQSIALKHYGIMLMTIPLFKPAYKYLNKSIKLSDDINDLLGKGQALQTLGYCYQWQGLFEKSNQAFYKSLDIFQSMGNLWEMGMTMHSLCLTYYYMGDHKQCFNHVEKNIDYCVKADDQFGICAANILTSWLYIEEGELEKAGKYLEKANRTNENYQDDYVNCQLYKSLGMLEIKKKNYKKALKYLNKSKYLFENNHFLKQFTIDLYHNISECYFEQFQNMKEDEIEFKKMLNELKKSCVKSLKISKKWFTHYGTALRLMAKYYGLINKSKKSKKLFVESIKHQQKFGRKYELAISYYDYGIFLYHKDEEKAKEYFKNALYLFRELNAKIYMNKINQILKLRNISENPLKQFIQKIHSESLKSNFMQLIQQIGQSKHSDSLLNNFINFSLEYIGSSRAFIFLKNDDDDLYVVVKKDLSTQNHEIEDYFSSIIVNKVLQRSEIYHLQNPKGNLNQVKYSIKSAVGIPIKIKDRLLGVFYLDNLLTQINFEVKDFEVIETLLRQIFLLIENKKLKEKLGRVDVDEKQVNDICKEHKITNREKEVLILMLQGISNKEISKKLFVTHGTVRKHLNSIYQKTGLETRQSLLDYFSKK